MKAKPKFAVALVTAPNQKSARKIAKAVLEARLAACANLIPGIESHYWWKGKINKGREVLILFKTTRRLLTALESHVVAEHPYDTPEFIVLSIRQGNKRYLSWVSDSVTE